MLKKSMLISCLGMVLLSTQVNAQATNHKTESAKKATSKVQFPPTLTVNTTKTFVSNDAKIKSMIINEKVIITNNYRLQNGGVRYLPDDIGKTKLQSKKFTGYESQQDLAIKKDRLSVFLTQDKTTAQTLGLYKQRMLAWNNGEVPYGTTIEKAVFDEAYFDFLNLPISQDLMTSSKAVYFTNRLSLLDMDILMSWLANPNNQGIEKPLIDVLSETIVAYRTQNQ